MERCTVENGGLRAVDEDTEKTEHAKHFVHRPFRDEPFLEDVRDAVETCAKEAEEVALEEILAFEAAVGTSDVVGVQQDAHAGTAD